MKINKVIITCSIILLLILSAAISYSQWQSIGDIDRFERVIDGIKIFAKPAVVQIKFLAPDVIRIRMSKDGIFLPDSSWAIIPGRFEDQNFAIKEIDDNIFLTTSKLSLKIKKLPCRLSIYDAGGLMVNQDEPTKGMAWSVNEMAVWKTMPSEEYYFGFGEKAGALQKKGKVYSMWNSDIPAYKADTDPLYQTIPFFYAVRNGKTYGIFFDNTYYSHFDMGKENPDQYSFGAIDGELNYYFIYGPKPKDVLGKYSNLIGNMPLPPKWAIGYQQCRWSYYPESKVREIATNFRLRKIPCDVIYLDIHYMDGYRCFTWDKNRFPNPKKMAGDLAKDGFKIVTIIDPGIKNEKNYWVYEEGVKGDHFVKYSDGKPFIGKVWPGECVFPDFTRPETREWWGSLYKGLIDVGIKGFWNDMNEPSVFDTPNKTFDLNVIHYDNGLKTDHRKNHNIYGMQMARGTYEGVLKLQPNERPFVLTRANYAGGHRYAAAWTGDNISTWEHLEMAVPMCLNLSISGQPFVGTDIGGFVGSPSGELYTRWLQLGTFTPLMRTHTEIGSKDQEPWSYGKHYETINRKSIEMRYKLLPYIYTQFYKAYKDGTPIMRPVFFDYPDEKETYFDATEFLFGNAFLVAPVLWEGQKKRDVRIPQGEWYNYWTDEKYIGPNSVNVDAPLERIPLFVKAGSIIPTQHVVQYISEEPIDSLTLEIYPAAEASTILYEDDGLSFNYLKNEFCLRNINLKTKSDGYEIDISNPEGSYRPLNRLIIIQLHDVKAKPSFVKLDKVILSEGNRSWIYNANTKILKIQFDDKFQEQIVDIKK